MKSADAVKILLILLAGVATALYGYFFAMGGGWTVRASLSLSLYIYIHIYI